MDIDTIWKMLEQYRMLLHDVYVAPYIFINFSLIVIFIFSARLALLINYEEQKAIDNNSHIKKEDKIYIIGHVIVEGIVGLLVCYATVVLTLADNTNYIVNYIIGPALGFIAGWAFDSCVIIKFETAGNSLVSLHKNSKSKKEGEKSSSLNSTNNITINVNNNSNDVTTDNEPKTNKATIESYDDSNNDMLPILSALRNNNTTKTQGTEHLEKDKIKEEEFDNTVIKAINEIKDIQSTHTEQIAQTSIVLSSIVSTLNTMKEASMNDKKVALKKLIYDCLDQGYATPEQNDKVTIYYSSYVSLGGNGEIKMLYEDHYKKLHIHRDNHQHVEKNSNDDSTGDRKQSKNCEYGEFDHEYIEKKSGDPVE